MADGLPAIGIVVAVLGVVKTMASINEPPAVLGAMIGGASGRNVPWRIHGLLRGRSHRLQKSRHPCRRTAVLFHHPRRAGCTLKGHGAADLDGNGPSQIPGHYQPSFVEMEQVTAELKIEG